MARIPTYQRQVAPEITQAPRALDADVDASGLGQSLQRSASDVYQVQQQEIQDANRTALLGADNKLGAWQNTALFDPSNGAFTKKGAGALNVTQTTLDQFDKQSADITESLANPEQKRMFQQAALQRREGLQSKLGSYEFGQQQQYKDDVDQSSIQLAQSSAALNYNDPQSVDQERLKMNAVYEQRADRLGWSPEEKQAQLQQANSSMSNAVIHRMVIDSPQKAQDLFGQYKDTMTANDQIQATNTIDQAFKRQEAEARQRLVEQRQMQAIAREELSGRLSDAQSALVSGVLPADMPSRHEIVSAYGAQKGPQIADQLDKLQSVGPVMQQLRTATPEQAMAIVDAHDPTKNVQTTDDGVPIVAPGFKTDNEIHGLVARAAQQFAQQREKDPASYVIQTSPAVQHSYQAAQQNPTPENNAAYITASFAEQKRQGVQDPQVLPGPQASAIATKMAQSTPDGQAQMLSQLSDTYGSAYPKVLSQIGGDAPVQTVAGMVGSANKDITTQRSGIFSQGVSRSPEFIQNTLLNGDAALKSKAYKLPPSTNTAGEVTTGPDKAFYDAANGLLDPASMRTYHAAYQSYYAGRAVQDGKYESAFEPGYAKEALAAIGLTPVDIGAGKTLPPYGMDPNTFKDRISAQYSAFQKSSGTTHDLGDVKLYAGPNSTYVVRDALGNKLTTLQVKP